MIDENLPRCYEFDGLCIILPRWRNGSLKVTVGLVKDVIERLEQYGEFARRVAIVGQISETQYRDFRNAGRKGANQIINYFFVKMREDTNHNQD